LYLNIETTDEKHEVHELLIISIILISYKGCGSVVGGALNIDFLLLYSKLFLILISFFSGTSLYHSCDWRFSSKDATTLETFVEFLFWNYS